MRSRFFASFFCSLCSHDKRRRIVGDLLYMVLPGSTIKRPQFDQRPAASQVVGFSTTIRGFPRDRR
ncbi:hypothetical protein KVT40_002565 [Elsinoe batatas]|uniref:Uncharacterized protein n=1 Tax=Elsinoe batatas TaxID=2601811 RepID=A0A8K0L4D1_9PEZI|nr:hypothetical protein KVT40_002565 [Elsinoe batatas]